MANIRDIKVRIDSVKSTKQITNAMKMVAASKLRKSQDRILKARPYADFINTMIQTLQFKNKHSEHPLFEENPGDEKKALIVVTSDRGLCGAFNSSIIKEASNYLKENSQVDIICIGKKGDDFFKKHDYNVIKSYINIFNEMDFSISREIAFNIIELFTIKEYDKVEIVYNEFKSVIQQNIILKQILPIVPIEDEDVPLVDYLYEPDDYTIMGELGAKYINVDIWRILLESSASEQGAQMTAMEAATDNATELIATLTLFYNRARQASITKEILEISSGAEALK
ncbi:MAG: ATP synthase F1 subunit gamma [Candidatus Cloacimonetes bacterium]|nr:ATP synthase F1 subunit gamma [Candidatus Cloacimonadota bacterium]